MTRLLLTVLLFLSSVPAYAEWVVVGGNQEVGVTQYVDTDTIRRNWNLVKIWALQDYKTIQTNVGDSFLSFNAQYEYDCTEERERILAFTEFLGNMGNGIVVYSESGTVKWKPVAPGSLSQTLWEVACTKK